ncbi:hypothetical protein [Jiangella mangrovi]|uniref:Uncharacterized protein n=1 Tax=Jiangella mangrovi TaxID=1524084 RepID=A0A7W9GXE8_9ACTN|nr:hypothetical protein [Jiangella mangrovi]MBB5791767.1 hypothetical protein [Jiangella mangrovi]
MKLRFIAIDTGKDGCPTLYASDQDSYVIQGWRLADPASVPELPIQEHETCVEVPARLLTALERPAAEGAGATSHLATGRGTYIIRGPEITDPGTLAQMNVPSHETAVEVPRAHMDDLARELAWPG